MPVLLTPFASAVLLLCSFVASAVPLAAAPLDPDVVPLAVAVSGAPTALASADLDADGMPDLIVAYAGAGGSTLVVYPGDVEAVYPGPGEPRTVKATTFLATPFTAPRVLASLAGRVAGLTAVDVDADGLKDIVAERALGGPALLVGLGDGTVGAEEPLDDARAAAARTRALALAPRHLVPANARAPIAVPDVYRMANGDEAAGAYRPSEAAKAAIKRGSKPLGLTPPADAFAVLPMRLNRDAVPDLVVLRPGVPAPEVLVSRAAATFVVTTTKDETGACDASCSLREALVAANATPDLDTIEFAIPTSDPGFQPATGSWLIQPKGTEYPVITEPVTIDGRTQPGFAGTPVIELDGGALSEDRVGFIFVGANSVLRGLVVNSFPSLQEAGENFCGCGVIVDADNSIFEGNYLGTDVTGTQAKSNGQTGIGIPTGANNLVGGTTPQARNVVSGNRESFFFHVGISTFISFSAVNNTIAGNYVGVDSTGFNALPNLTGILINSANNVIGGSDPGAGNVVAANVSDQVVVIEFDAPADGNDVLGNYIGTNAVGTTGSFDSGFTTGLRIENSDNATVGLPGAGNLISGNDNGLIFTFSRVRSTANHVVQGNMIGVDALGRPLGNNGPGIRLLNVFNSSIGGTGNGEGNVVAHNTSGPGVVLGFLDTCQSCTSGTFRGNQNRILSNRIFSNSARGIDLAPSSFGDGVTANDAGDGDSGANDLLNWPVLTGASSTGSTSTVNVQALTQGPASGQPYTLQFFANAACDTTNGNGEGQSFLGQATRSADGNAITVNLNVPIPSNYFVTATVTDSLGNTSEFSNCMQASGGPAPVASATPTPLPTATPEKTPLPGQTPTVAPTNIVGAENCDNCRDDDGDTIVDRNDPDCGRPFAYGFGAGVVGKARGKSASKCSSTLGKVGQGLVAKEQKLLQACVQAMLACVQLKPGDQACITKASAACAKIRDAIEALEDKLEAKVEKVCGEPPVPEIDLVSLAGLGYFGERSTCQASPTFVFGVDDADSVARCIHTRHQCQAEQLVSIENPRARELMQLGGLTSFGCVPTGANGAGQGLADPAAAKLLVKCAKGIQKSGAKFIKARLGGLQKCLAGVTKCIQEKQNDPACLTAAGNKCRATADKIGDGPKGAGTKARAGIAKACTGADAGLLEATGIGQTTLTGYCSAVGVPALTTASEVADCLVRHHACRVNQLMDAANPRARELLDIVGVAP